MSCAETVESLPELLNGTLSEARRAEVTSHLSTCDACRREWDDTRLAAAVFGSHLPARVLTSLAWQVPIDGFDLEVAHRHVGECPECAEDLALARASRVNAAESPDDAARRRPAWRLAAGLAAAVAAVAFVAGLALGGRDARRTLDAERRAAAESGARVGAEADRLRRSEADLRDRLARLGSPRVNLPLLELLPGAVRAGAPSAAPVLAIHPDDTLAALVLGPPAAPGPFSAELRDGAGRTLWTGDGLRPGPLGSVVLGVPTALLPEGAVDLVVRPEGRGASTTFSFQVRRPR